MSTPGSKGNGVLRWWSVGHLAPGLIALAVLVDLALRFVPSGWIGLDMMGMFAYRLPDEAFARNYRAQGRASGDLSSLANLPDRRIYRSVSVRTDAIGFRNAGAMRDLAGLVVGDSFSNGGSSNDGDLAAQVGQVTGCRLYNAAGQVKEIQAPAPERLVALANYLKMRGGLVVVERLERLGPPELPEPTAASPDFGRVPSVFERTLVWAAVSPARLLGEAAFKHLLDDRFLPNGYRRAAIEKTLANGDWMLFYVDEMKNYERHRPASIEYWTRLRAGLAPASLRMLVVLVPNKYTVYYRHLLDAAPTVVAPEEYLTGVEAALVRAGVPVVNLTTALQREAAEALRRGEYLYHRDDTHWNDAGIAVAAREIARVWARSGGRSCR